MLDAFFRSCSDTAAPQAQWNHGHLSCCSSTRTVQRRYAVLPVFERAQKRARQAGVSGVRPFFRDLTALSGRFINGVGPRDSESEVARLQLWSALTP